MAPKARAQPARSTATTGGSTNKMPSAHTGSRRQAKTPSEERASSNDNGEDDDDDNDFEEDEEEEDDEEEDGEDDEDDDDEDEEEDEDEVPEDVGGFDEKFLAQLLAMDPLLTASKAAEAGGMQSMSAMPSMSTGQQYPLAVQTTSNAHSAMQAATPFPNMPAYASAASTPSNEFYDGAINFLTDVLGSSDAGFWNQGNGNEGSSNWSNGNQTAPAAPSPAPTQTQFKNLQPLIGNLIARLKGQSIEENGQMPQVAEEDLVVLLQSLMAQRQAQMDRRNERHSDAASTWPQQQQQQQQSIPQQSLEAGLNQAMGGAAMQPVHPAQIPGVVSAPKSSAILDFDFGEDDDDPDFVPRNLDMAFGDSQQFAQALADVNRANNGGSQQEAEAWQQMIDHWAPSTSTTNATGGAVAPVQASPRTAARRTRSTSKNGEGQALSTSALRRLNEAQAGPSHAVPSADDSMEASSMPESSFHKGKGRRGKIYGPEEALERRREANRECARRQRARKKEEMEKIREEIERVQHQQGSEAPLPAESILNITQSLVGPRKRGRPLGSKNRSTVEEANRLSEEAMGEMEMADLRAENRMLRAEMHRLQEENARLRARAVRIEDMIENIGRTDLRSNKRARFQRPHHDRQPESEDDEEQHQMESYVQDKDPASQFLTYQPFRRAQDKFSTMIELLQAEEQRRLGGGQTSSRRNENQGRSSLDHDVDMEPSYRGPHPQALRAGRAAPKRGSNNDRTAYRGPSNGAPSDPTHNLQDLLRAAADEGAYHYGR